VKKSFTFCVLLLSSCLFAFSQTRTTITITDRVVTTTSYTDNEVILNNQTDLHITATTTPLVNSIINLNSENSWVFFDNIKPSVVSSYLQYINVNGQPAVLKSNVRMSIYKHGTVIIPHPSGYKPFQAFTGQNFTGDSAKYSLFTLNSALGIFNNKIRSFKLKRGYMVTLANSADGTGYSRVFIADNEDLLVPVLSDEQDQLISFIRVLDWEWVTKKGWCGYDPTDLSLVNPTWRYDWSAGGTTTSTVEYVPIKQNMGWPGYDEITNKTYVSHVLGFNEPDHTEQANVTVDAAIADWPNMLKTGLRVGAPATTNFGWLYDFMDKAKAKNYRVDFVAVHAYWGGKSPQNWYNDLKYIHDRTGRPIWITEWNNGANWTSEGGWPNNTRPLLLTSGNAAKQLADIKAILQVLDTASFIERYSIYNWVEDARAMVIGGVITPAGQYYADNKSVMAFNKANEVIPTFNSTVPSLLMSITGDSSLALISTDLNGEYNKGYVLEKKIDNGSYIEIQRKANVTNVQYLENFDVSSFNKVTFRMRTILANGSETANSNEVGFDITNGSDIQYGNLSISNVGWNNVLFKQAYASIPVIIFGSPTNNNFMVKFSNRVKQTNGYRFSFQLAPWAYQKVTTLSNAETIPYLILNTGNYDFGGLKALAAKATIATTWTNITFTTAFDTIPVVFSSQLSSSTTNATGVRIRNVTKTGFEAKIQKDISTVLTSETISYLAITPGKGIIDNKELIVGKTTYNAIITTPPYTNIVYGDTIENPIFLAQMQTCNDDTITATLRCQSINNTYAKVFKQRAFNVTTPVPATEGAGWMLLNPINTIQGLNSIKSNEIRVYPNPVAENLYFNQSFDEKVKVDIYNMYGILVKSEYISENKIDVKSLIPGYYLIKTSKNLMAKFIKL